MIFLVLVLAIISCKKDDSIVPTEPKKPDLILYTDISDTLLYCSIPNSSLGVLYTEKYFFDVDYDNVNDFVFSIWTYTYIFINGPHTHTSTLYHNVISAINASDSIILKSPGTPICFSEADNIGNNSDWVAPNSPEVGLPFGGPLHDPGRYIGLLKIINGKRHYGWVRFFPSKKISGDIEVQEFAINVTPGNTIKAGQKQ